MKKTVTFLIMVLIAFSLSSCVPLPTIYDEWQMTSQDGGQSEEGEELESNGWYGNTFFYKDVAIAIPEEWSEVTKEDFERIDDSLEKNAGDEILMVCVNPETSNSIVVMAQEIGEALYEETTRTEETFLKGMQKVLQESETVKNISEIRDITLGAQNYKYLTIHQSLNEESIIQYCAARKMGDKMLVIIYSGYEGITLDSFAKLFSNEVPIF